MFRSLYILYSLPSNPTTNWLGKNMIIGLALFWGVIFRELQLQFFRHFFVTSSWRIEKDHGAFTKRETSMVHNNRVLLNVVHEYIAHQQPNKYQLTQPFIALRYVTWHCGDLSKIFLAPFLHWSWWFVEILREWCWFQSQRDLYSWSWGKLETFMMG